MRIEPIGAALVLGRSMGVGPMNLAEIAACVAIVDAASRNTEFPLVISFSAPLVEGGYAVAVAGLLYAYGDQRERVSIDRSLLSLPTTVPPCLWAKLSAAGMTFTGTDDLWLTPAGWCVATFAYPSQTCSEL